MKRAAGVVIVALAGSVGLSAQATNTFPSSGNVGIGTTSPAGVLTVRTGANRNLSSTSMDWAGVTGSVGLDAHNDANTSYVPFVLTANPTVLLGGNVGIGTTNPRWTLESAGARTGLGADSSGYHWFVTNTGTSEPSNVALGFQATGGTVQTIGFLTNGAWRMRIGSDGNVGIGTENPGTYKLAVNGSIRAKEIVVDTGWSDYVFHPDYKLMPLKEIANYVREHHHLPEVPSEKEVQENGVSLGEMQSKLLAKIEELTLHMIQAEERSNRLEEQNHQLQQRIASLESASSQVK